MIKHISSMTKNPFLYLFIISTFFFYNCSNENKIKIIDFENVNNDSTELYANNNDVINIKKNLSQKYSHSGRISIIISPKNGIILDSITINNKQAIHVTIWRRGNSNAYLVIRTQDKKQLLNQIIKPVYSGKDSWEKISYIFRLPPFLKKEKLIINLYNNNNDKYVYFDDYTREVIENKLPDEYKEEAIYLNIDSIGTSKIVKYRNRAISDKTITKRNKKWVKANFKYKDNTYEVKLRLKGDWLDHISGHKWSMRIKIKGDNYWKGMKTFSIQNPDSKFIFDEYIYHEMLRDNNVLSPKYGFVPVYINGVFAGIFSFEEHFEKQLIENQERREGPILKFDEEAFWAKNNYNYNNKSNQIDPPFFVTSKIIPFDKKKIKKNNPTFNLAQNKLYTYKNRDSINNIIDFELFAKLYAIVEYTGAYHSITWHNIRFYYNPVSSILEPVAFDGFTETGMYLDAWKNKNFISFSDKDLQNNTYIFIKLFNNKKFTDKYLDFHKYAFNDNFLNDFFEKEKTQISKYEKLLNVDYPEIKYDYDYLKNRVKEKEKQLNEIDVNNLKKVNLVKSKSKDLYPLKVSKKYINIYPTKDSLKYLIENYNPFKIKIVGVKEDKDSDIIKKDILINAYSDKAGSLILDTKTKIKYIYITDSAAKNTAKIKVYKFYKPSLYNALPIIFENKDSSFYKMEGNKIILNNGNYKINKPIIIPSGYHVIINKNTNIDFINSSYLISYSPIFVNGTVKEPVNITSSDNSAKGITIIKANLPSSINYLNISNFNTLSENNWQLTGAVTFYASDVDINNMTINNNLSEDALNIVSSSFTTHNCNFNNIFSDAFDSDFSDGEIANCSFNNVKNDAIDFSGSKANITNCKMDSIGDKAVSAGERSNLVVSNTKVNNANIAFASKDKSILNVNFSEITNSYYAYASYVKKNEFGASKLIIKSTSTNNVKQTILLDKDCLISIDDKKEIGTQKIDTEKLYEKYKKK